MTMIDSDVDPAPAGPDERFRLLAEVLDAVPAAIAFWDRDLRNVFANRAAYLDWFGHAPDELRGRHSRELLGEDVFALNEPYMREALAGERHVLERVLVTPSGERRNAQIDYTPYVADGEVIGFLTTIIDISARVRAERMARESAERLAAMAERRRFEERAHDVILQYLFAAQLDVDRARTATGDETTAAAALDSASIRLATAVADLRSAVTGRDGP